MKNGIRTAVITIVVLVFLASFFTACGQGEQQQTESSQKTTSEESVETAAATQSEAVTETEDLDPVEVPEIDQGLITFFSGEVFILDGKEWWEVAIGDFVEPQDVIKTETDSYCEIQFGEAAVVKIQENTEINMENLLIQEGNSNIAVRMEEGSVLCKVKKLAGNDEFKVKTQTAVCGVRGTEFGVNASPDKKTKVAVKEGKVSVLPSSLDTDRFKVKVKDKGREVENIINKIDDAAPMVETDQEIEISEADVKRSEKTAQEIGKVVEEIAQDKGPQVKPEKLEKLSKTITDKQEEVAKTAEPPREISEQSKQELKDIEKMELIPVSAREEEAAEEEAPQPQLVKISVVVEPSNAKIFVNGELEGRGKFSRIYEEGKQLRFRIIGPGYAPHEMSFVASGDTQKKYRVKLAQLAEPQTEQIRVKASPNDADIYLQGKQVGKGTFGDEFELGQTLMFRVERSGYEEKTLQVDVNESSAKTYTVKLDKKKAEIGVQTYPSDADIELEGKQVAKGSFKDTFEVGEKLSFHVSKEGYEPETLEVDVKEDQGKVYDVSLTKIQKETEKKVEEIVIRTDPDTAEIYLDDRKVGTGNYAGTFDYGRELTFLVREEGYEQQRLSIHVEQGSGKIYSVSLQPLTQQITIQARPETADIYLDGRRVATGSYSDEYRYGKELSFRVREAGYVEQSLSVSVDKDTRNSYTVNLQPLTERVIVRTEPRSADIYLHGDRVGTGYYSQEFPHGEELTFEVREDGYAPRELSVEVDEYAGRTYTVALEALTEEITISTTPGDAGIYLDGEKLGTGTFTGEFQHGKQLSFRISKGGYREKELDVRVREGASHNYSVRLEKSVVTQRLQITTTPSDARILLDGSTVGRGSFSREYEEGTNLTFTFRKDGYEPQTRSVTVRSGMDPISVRLQEKTIQEIIQISGGQIVGSLTTDGTTVFAASNHGVLSAATLSGDKLWSINTKNSPNENSYPVLIGDHIFFSGSRELIIADKQSGEIISRKSLSGSSAHLFGRRVVEFAHQALFPTNTTVDIISRSSGRTQQQVSIPRGSRMTPGVWNEKIVLVDQQGSLLILDPDKNRPVENTIPTGAVQPVALGVTVYDDKAFFSGRKGTVVCIDLAGKQVLWERTLPGNASVYTDVQVGPSGAYVFSKGTIYGLSLQNGENLFSPIGNVNAAPLVAGGTLYYGSQKQLVLRNGATGSTQRTIDLDERISARPAITRGGKLIVGTDTGKAIVVNP